jgi:hypothetical protein
VHESSDFPVDNPDVDIPPSDTSDLPLDNLNPDVDIPLQEFTEVDNPRTSDLPEDNPELDIPRLDNSAHGSADSGPGVMDWTALILYCRLSLGLHAFLSHLTPHHYALSRTASEVD